MDPDQTTIDLLKRASALAALGAAGCRLPELFATTAVLELDYRDGAIVARGPDGSPRFGPRGVPCGAEVVVADLRERFPDCFHPRNNR